MLLWSIEERCVGGPVHTTPPPLGRPIVCTEPTYNTRSTGTVHTSAKARLTSVAIRIDPDPDPSPPKLNHLFTGPLPTFSENFMQMRSDDFAQSC